MNIVYDVSNAIDIILGKANEISLKRHNNSAEIASWRTRYDDIIANNASNDEKNKSLVELLNEISPIVDKWERDRNFT